MESTTSRRKADQEYKATIIGVAAGYASVVHILFDVPRSELNALTLLAFVVIARWYRFFWQMGPLCGVERRLGNSEAMAHEARRAFDGLWRRDAAVARGLSTEGLQYGRSMLVDMSAWWAAVVVVLGAGTAWLATNSESQTWSTVGILVTSAIVLPVGLMVELTHNVSSIRWINRQIAGTATDTA